jgi:hypothetical protein
VKSIVTKHWYLPVSNGRRYSEGPPGGGNNVGEVGSFANLDLSTYPVYSIDMALNDYQVFSSVPSPDSGTSTHNATGWPLGGGAFSRMTPPIVDDLGRGIMLPDLWRNATLAIQELNLRWEWRGSDNLASFTDSTGPKFLIAHSSAALSTTTPGDIARPMLYLTQSLGNADPAMYGRADTLGLAPAMGTFAGYGDEVYADTMPPLSNWIASYLQWYFTSDGDTGTFGGRPLIECNEVVTFEVRLISKSTTAYPRGLIAYRLYRENGETYEQGIPWDLDTNVPLGQYFQEFQQFGCGYWNQAPGGSHYMDVGGYITVARDFGGWLGRRSF